MGLALNSYGLAGQTSAVTLMTLLKLVAMPAIAWTLAVHVFALSPLAAGVIVVLAAMPVGANAYLFAAAYDRAPGAVSGAIAVSTPLSLVTVSALLLLLGAPGR
jgi:predicted permease